MNSLAVAIDVPDTCDTVTHEGWDRLVELMMEICRLKELNPWLNMMVQTCDDAAEASFDNQVVQAQAAIGQLNNEIDDKLMTLQTQDGNTDIFVFYKA
jgi:hypothetical protein